MEEGNRIFEISDWVPPWVDNGAKLHQIINRLIELDNIDYWTVIMVLVKYHLTVDLENIRLVNETLARLVPSDDDE